MANNSHEMQCVSHEVNKEDISHWIVQLGQVTVSIILDMKQSI